jgi:hypothetical protein
MPRLRCSFSIPFENGLQPLDRVSPLRRRLADGVLVAEQAQLVEGLGGGHSREPLHSTSDEVNLSILVPLAGRGPQQQIEMSVRSLPMRALAC